MIFNWRPYRYSHSRRYLNRAALVVVLAGVIVPTPPITVIAPPWELNTGGVLATRELNTGGYLAQQPLNTGGVLAQQELNTDGVVAQQGLNTDGISVGA